MYEKDCSVTLQGYQDPPCCFPVCKVVSNSPYDPEDSISWSFLAPLVQYSAKCPSVGGS